MSPAILTSATFAAVALLVLATCGIASDLWLRDRRRLNERLAEEFRGQLRDQRHSSLFKDLSTIVRDAGRSTDRSLWRKWLDAVEQAGISTSPERILWASAALGLAVGAVAFVVARNWWLAVLLGVVLAPAPCIAVLLRRARRLRRFSEQLPEAFEVMSRAVRAGQTMSGALQIIATDFDPPFSEEVAYCCEQQSLGIPQDVALRELARRTRIIEVQIFVVGLLVQRRSGGNLVDLLENLAAIMRSRLRFQGRVRALTGEGRMQAAVLLIMPVLLLLAMTALNPTYAALLWDRPKLLLATAVLEGVGAMWIRRIINFDY